MFCWSRNCILLLVECPHRNDELCGLYDIWCGDSRVASSDLGEGGGGGATLFHMRNHYDPIQDI